MRWRVGGCVRRRVRWRFCRCMRWRVGGCVRQRVRWRVGGCVRRRMGWRVRRCIGRRRRECWRMRRRVGGCVRRCIGRRMRRCVRWRVRRRECRRVGGCIGRRRRESRRGGRRQRRRDVVGQVVHEDVHRAISVVSHQVAGIGMERYVRPIAGQRRPFGVTIALTAARAHGDALRRPGRGVAHEDIGRGVGVARHKVRGHGLESDCGPVVRDGRVPGVVVGLAPRRVQREPRRLAGLSVVQEDVTPVVGVAADQVRRIGFERDVAAIAGDDRMERCAVCLPSARRHRDARRRAALPVVDEDVACDVGVAGHQVRGVRSENDVAGIGRQVAVVLEHGRAVTLRAVRGHRDAPGRAGLQVAHEHVGRAVGVARDDVRRVGLVRQVLAFGRERGARAPGVGQGVAFAQVEELPAAGLQIVQPEVVVAPAEMERLIRDIATVGRDGRILRRAVRQVGRKVPGAAVCPIVDEHVVI